MTLVDRAYALCLGITRALALLSGIAVVAMAFTIAADVLLRKTTSISVPGTDELGGYVFAATTAIAFSFALLENANVRIDALSRLTPPGMRAVIEIAGLVALGAFVFLVTWRGAVLVADSLAYDSRSITPLNTPLAVPQSVWLAGLCLYALNIVVVILMLLRHWSDRAALPHAFRGEGADLSTPEGEVASARTGKGG